MTNAETSTVVFKDQAGGYYLLPRETLEQGRVPAERTAEVERLIAESAAARSGEGDDTRGYLLPVFVVVCGMIGLGALHVIGLSGPLERRSADFILDSDRTGW